MAQSQWFFKKTVHLKMHGLSIDVSILLSFTFSGRLFWVSIHFKFGPSSLTHRRVLKPLSREMHKLSAPERSLAKTFEILTNEGSYRILSGPYLSYQIMMRLNAVCLIAFLSEWSFLSKHQTKNEHHNYSINWWFLKISDFFAFNKLPILKLLKRILTGIISLR